MSILKYLLVFLAVPVACFAVIQQHHMTIVSYGGAGGVTYDIEEDFDGIGYALGGLWTEFNSPEEDCTVGEDTNCPLSGTHSLLTVYDGDDTYSRIDYTAGINGVNTLGEKFEFTFSAMANGIFVVALENGGFHVMELRLVGTNIRINSGGVNDTGSTEIALDTKYYGWTEYQAGDGGANNTASFYINTSDSKPGAAEASITTGDETDPSSQLRFGSFADGIEVIFDNIKVHDTAIP